MSQDVQHNIVTEYYWHGNTTFNFHFQFSKGKLNLNPFETILRIKYYTKVLCTENYTQMHICFD